MKCRFCYEILQHRIKSAWKRTWSHDCKKTKSRLVVCYVCYSFIHIDMEVGKMDIGKPQAVSFPSYSLIRKSLFRLLHLKIVLWCFESTKNIGIWKGLRNYKWAQDVCSFFNKTQRICLVFCPFFLIVQSIWQICISSLMSLILLSIFWRVTQVMLCFIVCPWFVSLWMIFLFLIFQMLRTSCTLTKTLLATAYTQKPLANWIIHLKASLVNPWI